MKTTKKDFEYFKKRCEYWRQKFQMGNWDFGFHHEKLEKSKAEYNTNGGGRLATIWLSTEWNQHPSKEEIDKTAFHEVVEILLCELRSLASAYFSELEVNERTHMIVRTMENVVFPELR